MNDRTYGRLVFDSERAAAAVGRKSAKAFGRTLLYRSDRIAVDVFVQPGADELLLLHGQVVDANSGEPVPRTDVALAGTCVRTDVFGQFSLSEIAGGSASVLRVRTPEREVLCPIPCAGSDG